MATQPRLAGTLPSPEEARRRHKVAVKAVRVLEDDNEVAAESLKELRAALKKARAMLRSAEDDLDAIEEGRRPDRGRPED